jgi:hypothetical protein
MLKKYFRSLLIWPQTNVQCSQTLYQSLYAAQIMYSCSNSDEWRGKINHISKKIISGQNLDGGFDIGYNFNFGYRLFKKRAHESTTPEILSVHALQLIRGIGESNQDIDNAILKGIRWINRNIVKINEASYGIPYAPDTLKDVHILNGCTFALVPLCFYLSSSNSNDEEITKKINGIISFLHSQMETSDEYEGKYFRYFYSKGIKAKDERQIEKIDNYHLGQQLYYHCLIQKYYPSKLNDEIVQHLSIYLYAIRDSNGQYEYCNHKRFSPSDVQLWSYSSSVMAFYEAYKLTSNNEYRVAAIQIFEFIVKNGWNGEYFVATLDINGSTLDSDYYVRTNAWIAHMLAYYLKNISDDKKIHSLLKMVYHRLEMNGFVGPEKHVWTKRLKYAVRLKSILKGEENII